MASTIHFGTNAAIANATTPAPMRKANGSFFARRQPNAQREQDEERQQRDVNDRRARGDVFHAEQQRSTSPASRASMISATRSFGDDRKNQTISAAKSEPRIRCSFTASTAATM